jgi:hypothetical protein
MGEGSGRNVQITVAIIGLVGVLGAALIANWGAIFPRSKEPSPPPGPVPVVEVPSPGQAEAPVSPTSLLADSEKLAGEFINAMQRHDVGRLMEMAETPFYYDQQVLASREELRKKLEEAFSGPPEPEGLRIDTLKAQTVADFREAMRSQGMDPERDRVLRALRITDDDVVVRLTSKGEGILLFFRRVDSAPKLVGFWD